MSLDDDGPAISYKLLARGTRVVTADGTEVGTVDQVLDNVRENIFDGIVMSTPQGRRFVDAPEVERITAAAVTLSIDSEQAANLPAYQPGAPEYRANPSAGRLARLLGGGWRRR
jgi:sporulation protein YlmC with PRC-barrel domain